MRVLMVSALWPPRVVGGAELYASELADRLGQLGHEIAVVTLGDPGDGVFGTVRPFGYQPDEYAEQGRLRRSAYHVADLYRFATRRVLTEAAARFRPDVVHTHGLSGLSTSALTTPSALGLPHVHTVHDYWLLCERLGRMRRDGTPCESICASCVAWSRTREVLVSRHKPDVLLVGSRDAAHEHTERLHWTRGRTRVVHPPVPEVPPPPPRLRGEGTAPVFGYLGRLEPAKGIRTLVAAFGSAPLGGSTLVVGGEGPLRGELEAEAHARVRFEGWLDDRRKDEFFEAIDCLVVPSEWRELAGLVVLEARARRLPVIGARIGGIPELIADESRPLLFGAGDKFDLIRALTEAAHAPERFRGSKASAASTWSEHLAAVCDAYRDAGGRARGAE